MIPRRAQRMVGSQVETAAAIRLPMVYSMTRARTGRAAFSPCENAMASTSGPRNLITDVPGILVGQAEDRDAITGTTVVLAEKPATASVDVRGGAPGTRETELLGTDALVDQVDALVLSGGSAFGLDAAGGVMAWLAAAGRGFAIGSTTRSPSIRVPIVPAAILFDLGFPGRRMWLDKPPYRTLGRSAVGAAAKEFAQGNAGAGLGATAGRLKGGIGSASLVLGGGVTVGAIVAVNSWGSAVWPDCGRFWSTELALPGEIDPQPAVPGAVLDPQDFSACKAVVPGANTTIAVVATDAALDKGGCRRLAIMAQDGLARAIRPIHTPFDGDTVFALATGEGSPPAPAMLLRLGSAAADCLARAVMRALTAAEPLAGVPSWRQLWRQPNATA
jgi:L-aminopeptidase/D-esterase-like protein